MSIERRLRRKNSRQNGKANMEPIKLNERAAKQVRDLVDGIERAQQQAQTYIAGLVAGMDVPEGWQLAPRAMAFGPPPAPAPVEPEPGGEGTADAA